MSSSSSSFLKKELITTLFEQWKGKSKLNFTLPFVHQPLFVYLQCLRSSKPFFTFPLSLSNVFRVQRQKRNKHLSIQVHDFNVVNTKSTRVQSLLLKSVRMLFQSLHYNSLFFLLLILFCLVQQQHPRLKAYGCFQVRYKIRKQTG